MFSRAAITNYPRFASQKKQECVPSLLWRHQQDYSLSKGSREVSALASSTFGQLQVFLVLWPSPQFLSAWSHCPLLFCLSPPCVSVESPSASIFWGHFWWYLRLTWVIQGESIHFKILNLVIPAKTFFFKEDNIYKFQQFGLDILGQPLFTYDNQPQKVEAIKIVPLWNSWKNNLQFPLLKDWYRLSTCPLISYHTKLFS